ncbi:MAG TPA: glycosyltransferase family 9 protein [Chitinispirillaceae bacterium]|nr:glycosyltransferase family 9 protein [Chitinispirillaceae bacterium]
MPNQITTPKRIAVIMPGETAEFILALSVITRMTAECENEIVLIIEQQLASLCSTLTPLTYILSDAYGKHEIEKLNKMLKHELFIAVYDLSGFSKQSWIFSKCNGQKKVSLYDEKSKKTGDVFPLVRKHITDDYSEIVGVLPAPVDQWPGITLECDPEYEGMIVLCPGSVKGAGRQWPYYKELIKYLSSQEFVILGDEHDVELCKTIAPRLPHRVRNIAGKISLDKAASILAGASIVISNDSGYLHLAGYIGVPSVGLFGSSSPSRSHPLGARSKVLYADILCSPCDQDECTGMHLECITRLTVEMLVKVMNNSF